METTTAMMTPVTNPRARPPTVLLVGREERFAHWMRDLLERGGIALLRAESLAEALRRLRGGEPDLLVVESDLPNALALEACRRLRYDPYVGPHTPILLVTSIAPSRSERLAALRAGAWDVLGTPLDADETLLKINAYTRSKLLADVAIAEALVDPETGMYNGQGLGRLAREFGALAVRAHAALACLVVSAEPPDRERTGVRCAHALRAAARSSDLLGRLGPAEFAVMAPGTDLHGARQLAARLERALAQSPAQGSEGPLQFRIGYDAVDNMAYAAINAMELLGRANLAERRARGRTSGGIVAYGEAIVAP